MTLRYALVGVLAVVLPMGLITVHGADRFEVERFASLPQPASNNAVAFSQIDGKPALVSLLGLDEEKTWSDIRNDGFVISLGEQQWQALPPLPISEGRLASAAVSVNGLVHLFGGYTVSEQHEEVSTPEVLVLSPDGRSWSLANAMPVPVDDATVLVWRDRWVYLVSGWHDVGNVNLVQVLDTQTGKWSQAEPWPGEPVFGQAGGLAGDQMVVCDGVRIDYPNSGGARQFLPSNECWLGQINPDDPRRIAWRPLEAHPGAARYRMAAGALDRVIYFVGGSLNPYNYNGIGYDREPSEPEAGVFGFDLESGQWRCFGELPVATMDHRGLPTDGEWLYVIGGMRAGQRVTDEVFRFKPGAPGACD